VVNDVHDLLIGLLGTLIWAAVTWAGVWLWSRFERRRLRMLWPFWDESPRWWRGSRRASTDVRVVIATSTEAYRPISSGGAQPVDAHLKPGTGIGQVRALAAIAPSVHRAWPKATGVGGTQFSKGLELDGSTHLVLIGGPRTNQMSAEFLTALHDRGRDVAGGRLPFHQEGSVIRWGERAYHASQGLDFGLVVRAPNPYDSGRSVVLLSGASTFGTEAAARWYVGRSDGARSPLWKEFAQSTRYFAALVQVDVSPSGHLSPPAIVEGVEPVEIRPELVPRRPEPDTPVPPPIEIRDRSVMGKATVPALCEDAVVVSDWFVGFVDGATDVTGRRYNGRTGGRFAAEVLDKAVAELDSGCDAVAAVAALSGAMAEELFETVGMAGSDGPSAAITLVSLHRREVWQIGDVAWWLLDGTELCVPEPKPIDVVTGDIRAAVLQARLDAGASLEELRLLSPDPGRAAAEPLLRAQSVLRNGTGPWAYGAIDGRPVPENLVSVTRLPDAEVEIVIASDGYPRPGRTLAAAEAELARLLAEDPLCIGPLRGAKGVHPGHSSFDDRAYLRLTLPATREAPAASD
jgi:hypothetical protein